jgi:hypothetical protein
MVNLTNITGVALPTNVNVYDWHFVMDLGLLFGLLSVAFAIWFGFGDKLRDFLVVSKKREIDEKVAMLYGYSESVRGMGAGVQTDLFIERLLSDIRALGRMKKSIKDEQKEQVIVAKNRLVNELRTLHYNQEANRVEEVFTARLW